MSSRKLEPMSLSEVGPALIEKLKPFHPQTLVACYVLETYLRWQEIFPDVDIKLLGPDGDPNDGLFVTYEPTVSNSVFVNSLEDNLDELQQMLMNCEYIDWSSRLGFGPTLSKYHQMLEEVFAARKLERGAKDVLTRAYFCEPAVAAQLTYQCPEDVRLGPITETYAEQIDNSWPHRFPGSCKMIEYMLKCFPGLGVFDKESDELLCWILRDESGCPGLLHTIEKARRKGYAELVVRAISRMFGEEGRAPHVCIVKDNFASRVLFTKLKYTPYDDATWFLLAKKEQPGEGSEVPGKLVSKNNNDQTGGRDNESRM